MAILQFIKGAWEPAEKAAFAPWQDQLTFLALGEGFTWETQDKEKDTAAAVLAWEAAEKLLQDESIDCLMLDELTYMISYHYLPLERIEQALLQRPSGQHVVVTGRACHRRIIEMADTVSEVQVIKHAFDNGMKAQRGIDW